MIESKVEGPGIHFSVQFFEVVIQIFLFEIVFDSLKLKFSFFKIKVLI